MTDTQWPRFIVFLQERSGASHKSIGSVHAPDAEMALINARNVFVRRPQCHSLWVIPAHFIFSKTVEEIMLNPSWDEETIAPDTPLQTYYVFQKNSQRRSMTYVTHVGEVEAPSPIQALKKAFVQFKNDKTIVWWVCPAQAIHRSQDADIDSFFAPAKDKIYRMPNQYHTVFTMQKIKRSDEKKEPS